MVVKVLEKRMVKNVLKGRKLASAPQDLQAECKYWAQHFARKNGAGFTITQTRRGGCKINWNENWGGYSIEGNEIGNVIVWSSGRDKAANLPREIEKLVAKVRKEARNMFSQETRDWAREVAFRYANTGVRSPDECENMAMDFAKSLRVPFEMWDGDSVSHTCYFYIDIQPFRGSGVSVSTARSMAKGWAADQENKKALSNLARAIKSAMRSTQGVRVEHVEKPKTFAEYADPYSSIKPERFYNGNRVRITVAVERYV